MDGEIDTEIAPEVCPESEISADAVLLASATEVTTRITDGDFGIELGAV